MLCFGCIQVPGSEAEQENENEEEEEEEEEEGSLISEQGPQNQDVRTLHVGIPYSGAGRFISSPWESM